MIELNHINLWNLQALAIDFAIIFALFISLRLVKGLVSNVKATDEIASKDNFAFGVSFAGGIAALAFVLSGASQGEFSHSLLSEATNMAVFGIVGLVLITLGRWIQDKLVLSQISLHDEIAKGNLAAAIVDVGNAIAVGIVIRAAMLWVETEGFLAIPVIIAAFVVSQIVLMLASKYRVKLFKVKASGDNSCMQQALEDGNCALALRYSGYLTGTALAITAASGLVPYNADNVWVAVLMWAVMAIVLSVAFGLIKALAMKLILPGVDSSDEVDNQQNVGVAAIETAVALAIGLTLATLLA
ncbi:MAG: uncharacterized membrane protein YjfL (UPF0719 family) [Phenylobacterium sp.]|jgi:uncharacterized membrane protein YjfL (UPF0719 family)